MRNCTPKRWTLPAALLVGLVGTAPAIAALSDVTNMPYPPGFAHFDRDLNGRISLEEFTAAKKDERAFKDADSDRDGFLNPDEYVKAISLDSRLAVADYASDSWITARVKTLLLRDSLLTGMKIDVETQDRMVQLSGWLDSTDKISRAVHLANQVPGVKVVLNDLRLAD